MKETWVGRGGESGPGGAARSVVVLAVLVSLVLPVCGGTPNPSFSGQNDSASIFYTLTDLYNLINKGTAGTKRTTFAPPANGPTSGGTHYTIDELYFLAEHRARVPKTGQTPTVPQGSAPAGSDGALQKGVDWPHTQGAEPTYIRFTDNGNGTVTDNLTGLIWLKNASCTVFFSGDTTGFNYRSWANALVAANSLASGYGGLTDLSIAGAWRLPNLRELQSLIDYRWTSPALCDTAGTVKWTSGNPFTGVQSESYCYWSSTTYAGSEGVAWGVFLSEGSVFYKEIKGYVWPVRGGQ